MLRRRDVLLTTVAAGLFAATGRAQAAASDLIDEHWLKTGERNGGEIDHDPWHTWLKNYVVVSPDGVTRVRYGEVSPTDRDKLTAYIDELSKTEITSFGRDDQMACWVNLYNAVTVDLILREYPVSSIKDITDGLFSFGPWGIKQVAVEGRSLSLDDIEHGVLRPIWRDPRVHYAVNCASIGCPNLALTAYRGFSMDARLDQAARSYINHPRGAMVDKDGRLVVSSIYEWFQEDFGDSDAGVIEHLDANAEDDLKASLASVTEIYGDHYDWSLNDGTGLAAGASVDASGGRQGSGSRYVTSE